MLLHPAHHVSGTVTVPSDKSISHRSVIFGSIAEGTTRVKNCLFSADCLSTISCFKQMGIRITKEEGSGDLFVEGKGLDGLKAPQEVLDTGNSGTTTRLLAGLLSGQEFPSTLSGDASLNSRPMKRVLTPLTEMGADIKSRENNGCAPLDIRPSHLHGIHYQMPIASAQVKSCLLLAGLYADSPVTVTEPAPSRDHSERMLSAFGASISKQGLDVSIQPRPVLHAQEIDVPGDISSAAYFIAAALLLKGSSLLIRNVGINPTRAGILTVCEKMGADIKKKNEREVSGEPVCDLLVKSSFLHGTVMEGDMIPSLIDEIPILAVMAALSEGETIIRDAADLKAKETDRIHTTAENLKAMGADVVPTEDGFLIHGKKSLHGANLESFEDHRIAMAFTIAALCADGDSQMSHPDCVRISWPSFYESLEKILVK